MSKAEKEELEQKELRRKLEEWRAQRYQSPRPSTPNETPRKTSFPPLFSTPTRETTNYKSPFRNVSTPNRFPVKSSLAESLEAMGSSLKSSARMQSKFWKRENKTCQTNVSEVNGTCAIDGIEERMSKTNVATGVWIQSKEFDRVKTLAIQYAQESEFEKVICSLKEWQNEWMDAESWILLANSFEATGQFDEAIRVFERAEELEIEPLDVIYAALRECMARLNGRKQEADESIELNLDEYCVVEECPKTPETNFVVKTEEDAVNGIAGMLDNMNLESPADKENAGMITALTPVKLNRKSDQEVLQTKTVITPVRRSLRNKTTWGECADSKEEMVAQLLEEQGLVYIPNKTIMK